MKSSVLVPVILVVCLLALALLISRAFSAARDGQDSLQGSTKITSAPERIEADSAAFYDAQGTDKTPSSLEPGELEVVSEDQSTHPASSHQLNPTGEYFVIAGTFRQVANAQNRVEALRQAGFSDTEMSKFDRGTYAVALVSRSAAYEPAITTAGRVRAAGFEAKVYRKR